MANIKYSIHAAPDSIPVVHSNWYPPIAAAGKNQDYACLLMPDLASAASEMTTVHQYLFQSWTIGKNGASVRRVIERMVRVEQRHYAIIGRLIALLGEAPECRSQEPKSYWCGDMVDYSRDLKELLANNAAAERYAAVTYESQSKEIKDPHVSRMLARLALDERLHHQIFCDFLAQIGP